MKKQRLFVTIMENRILASMSVLTIKENKISRSVRRAVRRVYRQLEFVNSCNSWESRGAVLSHATRNYCTGDYSCVKSNDSTRAHAPPARALKTNFRKRKKNYSMKSQDCASDTLHNSMLQRDRSLAARSRSPCTLFFFHEKL